MKIRNAHQILMEISLGRCPFAKLGRTREKNTKINLRDIFCEVRR
jgi:hypothetical protein